MKKNFVVDSLFLVPFLSFVVIILAIALASAYAFDYTFTSFSYPGAASTFGGAINDGDTIVGNYVCGPYSNECGFILSGGTYTSSGPNYTYGGINNAGTIVCSDTAGNPCTPSNGTYTTFNRYPGAASSGPTDINNVGTIVGEYMDTIGFLHGFSLSDGVYTPLNYPAFGINDAGTIVGNSGDGTGRYSYMLCNNDWIIDPPSQLGVYNSLVKIIAELKVLVGHP